MTNAIKTLQEKHFRLFALLAAICFGVLTTLMCSALASAFYPYFSSSFFYNDANMFYYMGSRLLGGATPYVDFYDHKGLYIMYYTAAGILLGGKIGMFIVETIVFTGFFYGLIHIAKVLGFRNIWGLALCLAFSGVYGLAGQNPSDTELALPFIAAALYFFIKGRKGRDYTSFMISNAFSGVAAGIAINIRPSDAMVSLSMVCGFLAFVLLDRSLDNKGKTKTLFIHAGITVGAIIVTCLPAFFHSLIGGFTRQMYEATILSNFKYVGKVVGGMEVVYCRVIILASFLSYLIPTLLKVKEVGKEFLFVTLPIALVQFFVQYFIAFYYHYFLISAPTLGVFFFEIASYYKLKSGVRGFAVGLVGVMNLLALVAAPINYHLNQKPMDEAVNEFVTAVIAEEERDDTLCYLAAPGIYNDNHIVSPWPDFAVQGNHRLLNENLSQANLVKFLSEGNCHYVIFMEDPVFDDHIVKYVQRGINMDGLRQEKKFEKIDGSSYVGDKYIDIYHYIG